MEEFVIGVLVGVGLTSVVFFVWDSKVWLGVYKLIDYRNDIKAQIKEIHKRKFNLIQLWLNGSKEEKKNIDFEEKVRRMHRELRELETTFRTLERVLMLFGIEKKGGE
jgi:uncharacterized membrane protein YgaE (UPF0421/DUF939 family)